MEFDKRLARKSEGEWREIIHTKRCQKVWMRKEVLSMS